jgi:predicted dehydrogenase
MTNVNRRYFLGASAAMAANLTLARGDEKKVSPNEKINVALVGCGGMGRANLRDFIRIPEFNVIGLCDVDTARFKDAIDDLKKANRPTDSLIPTQDFRKIVENKDINAVIVATPDHWHAYVLIAACANDKDVYCEKPLSHNIVEGRAMVKAAQGKKRVVQIGTQQRSGKHFQDAVQFVRSGKLGHVHTTRTWITNGTDAKSGGNPPDEDKAPDGVDYNLWLGPAPLRKFNKNRFHYNFRWFWDYGNGLCNDWGVHLNDIILWGMNVKAPLSVSAIGGRYDIQDNSDTPDSLDIYFEFPGFTHVYTVRRGQSLVGFHGKKHGMEFSGSNGTLTLDRGGWFITPEGEKLTAEKHPTSEQHFAHVQNFLHCIRNRSEKTASDIEDMHRATTLCHLANISYKVKRRLYWDAEKERCYRGYDPATKQFKLEDAEANAYLLREPRKPWSLTI